MFGFIKEGFIIGLLSLWRFLASIINASDRVKSVSLNNQQCIIQPTLTNLYLNKYIERLSYYPFAVNLKLRLWHF